MVNEPATRGERNGRMVGVETFKTRCVQLESVLAALKAKSCGVFNENNVAMCQVKKVRILVFKYTTYLRFYTFEA